VAHTFNAYQNMRRQRTIGIFNMHEFNDKQLAHC